MKWHRLIPALLLLSMTLSAMAAQTAAQGADEQALPLPADPPPLPGPTGLEPPLEPRSPAPDQVGWQYGPLSDFQYQRFDGAFVPGPAGEPWANKVYFLGGRTSSSTESPNIWVFDPVSGVYTDTQADMIEDVSNYNVNLIMDDGTDRGPALYVIGGYDKDGGGGNLGTVQRYYPQYNLVEALSSQDDWPGTVAGYTVGAMGTAVVDDIIYVFGGWESVTPPYFYDGTWAFDPKQPSGSRWTDLGVTLNTPRSYLQSAAQGGRVYALGGIHQYTGSDLVPTAAVEVLDTNDIAAGWSYLSPMPMPVGEGRAFGFDDDTLGGPLAPWSGFLYVAAGGDWPDYGLQVMEYDIAADTWNMDFADLNEERGGPAGVFVPLCTADPYDGLPGMWVFGGRWDDG